MTPQITLVLGKPPQRSPVLPEVIDRLRTAADVTVAVPEARHRIDPWAPWLRDADVVAVRGLDARTLADLAVAEQAGVCCCNRVVATLAVRVRALSWRLLVGGGVPVPNSAEVMTWADAVRRVAGRPSVVKAADASRGRGAGVAFSTQGELPEQAPFSGPYLVQDHVAGDGVDRKLYVIGGYVAGLRKPWPRPRSVARGGEPFTVPNELAVVARRVGAVTGLEIYGVDVIEGPAGPVVIDVNPFPSCAGVRGAGAAIAAHLLAAAR